MDSRPPARFLEALGWLAIRWSGLELMIETSCACLFKAGLGRSADRKPPRPFKTRIKFIRQALRDPMFAHLRDEYGEALRESELLSLERNDRMHGAFTSWSGSEHPLQTVIISHDQGYIAMQDIRVTESDLENLADRIGSMFFVHFNLVDRMRAIIRAFEGDSELGRRMKAGG